MTQTASPLLILFLLWISSAFGDETPNYKDPPRDSPHIFFAEPFVSTESLHPFVASTASKEGVDKEIAQYDGRWEVAPDPTGLEGDLALVMKDKAKHHAVAAKLRKTFKPGSRPLVFQYEVKFRTDNPCGGAYVKLLSRADDVDFSKFNDKTPYTLMFGPDRCGTRETLHLILRHVHPISGIVEEKHANQPKGFGKEFFEKGKTRLYRLVIYPDSAFEISVDRKVVSKGHLLSDMTPPLVPEEIIDDPDASKPEDWDDRATIPDPDAVKPEDWDEDAPKRIVDESAEKPEGWLDHQRPMIPDRRAERPADWDDEMDGQWEAPLIENPICQGAPGCGEWNPPTIENPAYKGKWRPPLVANPAYKGVWKPRKIANPAYFEELNPFERMTPIDAVGLELWSMSENVAFDNFILANDVGVVDEWTETTWTVKAVKEGSLAPSGPTFLHKLFDAANERPWLWVVYLLGVLIPICVMTMIFCPVKKETGTEGEQKAHYDALPTDPLLKKEDEEEEEKTKEEAAMRKKTDEPSPDVVEEDKDEEEPVRRSTPVKSKARLRDAAAPTANGVVGGGDAEAVAAAEAEAATKAALNGFFDEDEILRRSPRLRSKVRARRE